MNITTKTGTSSAVYVSEVAYEKQLTKKSTYYANIIIWTVLFLYPLLGILDYVYAYPIYQALFLTKVIIVLLIYAVYDISMRLGKSSDFALHTTILLISLNASIICNIVPFDIAPVFFMVFASLAMLFNLVVFWNPVNSFGHFFTTLIFIAVGYHLLNTVSVETYITQGAGLFIIIFFFSCFIPMARYGIIRKNTLNNLRLKNTTAQLNLLHDELVEKNQQVEISNSRLTGLVMQQDSFMAFVREDILSFVSSINSSANAMSDLGSDRDNQQRHHITMINENILRLKQLAELFPNDHSALSSDIVLSLKKVDLLASVQAVADCLSKGFGYPDINFNVNPQKKWAAVQLDQLYTDQILFNLFANCFKFCNNNENINCHMKESNNRLHLIINCIAPGIAADLLANEWESAVPTAQSLHEGLGPGFYIAKLLAEKMGGELIYHKFQNHSCYVLAFNQ
ncbi:sensor histidine kinase [Pedobacter sp. KACC 23697]|uniref:HAMP domain-containing histidine kinase n=1 Tax=Pedobacter sp. KACC 23697 TaxID=3149230 RepID=A0AAU7JZY7_9SPHI